MSLYCDRASSNIDAKGTLRARTSPILSLRGYEAIFKRDRTPPKIDRT
ncbi:hypothetical protein [Geminocystis herdmanii]|nr:hypothetical protein [Geminocystis herdmanii]